MPLYSTKKIRNRQQLALYMHFDSNFTRTVREELECSICMDTIEFGVKSKCGHHYCRDCVFELINVQSHKKCAYCRTSLKSKEYTEFYRRIDESEIKKYPFPRSLEGIKVLAMMRGMQAGFKYAEAFNIIRVLQK